MAIGAILLCNLIAKTLCLFQKASAKRVFLPLTSCFPSSPALFTHLGSRNKANCPQDFLQSKQDKDTSAPEIYHHLQGTTTHYPCQQLTEISQQAGQLGFRKQAGYALRHTVQGGGTACIKHEQVEQNSVLSAHCFPPVPRGKTGPGLWSQPPQPWAMLRSKLPATKCGCTPLVRSPLPKLSEQQVVTHRVIRLFSESADVAMYKGTSKGTGTPRAFMSVSQISPS